MTPPRMTSIAGTLSARGTAREGAGQSWPLSRRQAPGTARRPVRARRRRRAVLDEPRIDGAPDADEHIAQRCHRSGLGVDGDEGDVDGELERHLAGAVVFEGVERRDQVGRDGRRGRDCERRDVT